MKKNEKMQKLINEVENEKKDNGLITSKFLDLFFPKIIEWEGCVLLTLGDYLNDLSEKFSPNDVINDKTQFEATHNHIHLTDIFTELEENPNQSLRVALRLVEVWEQQLKVNFPSQKFHLVISHDEFGSVVRFYKLRTDEIPWININNIDNFKEEAILIKEI